MDALKNILAKKKQEVQQQTKDKDKKWVRRGEVEADRERRYREEEEKERREREEKKRQRELEEESKRKTIAVSSVDSSSNNNNSSNNSSNNNDHHSDDISASNKRSKPNPIEFEFTAPSSSSASQSIPNPSSVSSPVLSGSSTPPYSSSSSLSQSILSMDPELLALKIPKVEVFRRLRAMGKPVTLFGETDATRIVRLQKLEVEASDGKSEGQRNIYQEFTNDDDDGDVAAAELKKKKMLEEEFLFGLPKDPSKVEDTASNRVLNYLRFLMQEWGADLNTRSEAVKNTREGKQETVTYKTTREFIKPLLKHLIARNLDKSILDRLDTIIQFLKEKEYVKANDEYIRLSIGNAPWPMGVTMIGIHERSSREKIEGSKVAHVLNDETTRKYVQSVKRLMSICQKKRPTVPSKMVL